MNEFTDIDSTIQALENQQYICSKDIATTVYLALKMQKPVLIEGPAGVGKTDLGRSVAKALDMDLIRLQCYEGLDEAKSLYEWEYAKQLLYTQILKDKLSQVLEKENTLEDAIGKLTIEDDIFFSEKFLIARPILKAITSSRPTLLLIDEVDKSDPEFEAFLLEVLSDFQVSIPEIGTIKALSKPAVFLTSNNSREMSDALKRRCLHLYIEFPSQDLEMKIVRLKVPECGEKLGRQLVDAIHKIRDLPLKKDPSISETLDWGKALAFLGCEVLDNEIALETLNVLIKYEKDIELVKKNAPTIFSAQNS